MVSFTSLESDLRSYLDQPKIEAVNKAFCFAADAHTGQTRKSGEPYISHPLAVARILAQMHMDHQCLMAALLHDVIEDTGVPKHTLGKEFSPDVAELVDGVSKLSNIFETSAEAQAENFQKMTLAMAKDIRVILVKLADRLHNMRTLDALSPEKRRRIARETLEIYAPIANRLGMNNIRVEFEELGFRALHPLRSSMIEKAVKKQRGNRREMVNQLLETLEEVLAREGIESDVVGREKHLYSIYEKMRSKSRSFDEIMDVYAYRIIVDSVDTCYRTLGVVHNLYKPVVGRFKDYIAIPKANGYQSLHTSLLGSHGVPIEIQIRTREMNAVADNGIAGHWLYKSNEDSAAGSHTRARAWVKGLLDIQQSAGSSMEFIEHVKTDLFPEEVYVFTPTGEILDLPQASTPVDFAYSVHTDIGNTCVACRIDRRLAPLSTALESGQTVEIITAPGAQPNPAWLSFVVTGKARTSIRHALRNQQRSESITLGERLLERTLQSMDSSLDQLETDNVATALTEGKFESMDDLLEAVGLGNQMSYVVARRLLGVEGVDDDEDTDQPLAIKGTEGVVVTYARCCRPLPGDPILGHISAGRGIVVHAEGCKNMASLLHKHEETMPVAWATNIDQVFPVELRVELAHDKNVIAVLASTITNAEGTIDRISMDEKGAQLSIVNITLGVRDRVHLAHVIRRLRTIKGAEKIERFRS